MWKRIDSPGDLPSIGDPETLYLDFKAVPSDSGFEIGKDVAAFANASGGVILVGAVEEKKKLIRFKPLTDPIRTKDFYTSAVRDRCRPHPTVGLDLITIDDSGGQILAANVEPFPGQPVGVHVTVSDQGEMKPRIQDLFHYPVRVYTDTKAILPENLAMYVDARVRRIAILLEPLVGSRVIVQCVHSVPPGLRMDSFELKGVSVAENTIEFGSEKSGSLFISLDLVHSVHRTEKTWLVFVQGYFDEISWQSGVPDELKSYRAFFHPVLSEPTTSGRQR
jgi:hypothetical protein